MDGGIPLRDRAAATPTPGRALRSVIDTSTATPFEGFFRRNHDFVWRNLRRLGVEAAVVDDALQDVFVTAHRRIGQLRDDASERAWLYTILRRVAFRYRRSAQRRRRKIDALEMVAPSEHRDHTAEGFDARRFMHQFLEGLGDKRGPVFAMVELEGMSAPEVADALGLKVNTVYSRLRLGREAFDREVERRRVRERDELLARARQADDPPVGAAAAAWMLLDPRLLGHGGSGGVWSLASQVKVFAVTVAVGTVIVAGARVVSSERPQPAASGASRVRVAESTASAPAPVVAAIDDAEVTEPTAESAPVAAEAPSRTKAHARPARSGIDVEAAMLKRAKAAMTSGRASAALRELDAHARRFPDSGLADLRDAMRVSALCEAGDVAKARAAASKFEREHPRSRFAERVRSTCRGDGS